MAVRGNPTHEQWRESHEVMRIVACGPHAVTTFTANSTIGTHITQANKQLFGPATAKEAESWPHVSSARQRSSNNKYKHPRGLSRHKRAVTCECNATERTAAWHTSVCARRWARLDAANDAMWVRCERVHAAKRITHGTTAFRSLGFRHPHRALWVGVACCTALGHREIAEAILRRRRSEARARTVATIDVVTGLGGNSIFCGCAREIVHVCVLFLADETNAVAASG